MKSFEPEIKWPISHLLFLIASVYLGNYVKRDKGMGVERQRKKIDLITMSRKITLRVVPGTWTWPQANLCLLSFWELHCQRNQGPGLEKPLLVQGLIQFLNSQSIPYTLFWMKGPPLSPLHMWPRRRTNKGTLPRPKSTHVIMPRGYGLHSADPEGFRCGPGPWCCVLSIISLVKWNYLPVLLPPL